MVFFQNVEPAPPDPIFGLNTAFVAEKREKKVNLGVGSYKTDELTPFLLQSVFEAETLLLKESHHKEYLPIEGDPTFLHEVKKLVLGKYSLAPFFVAQCIGGTGALRLLGAFLHKYLTDELYLSNPTWVNHARIFSHAGFKVSSYPYFNKEKKEFDFSGMRESLKKMKKGSLLLLHASCHNPTGIDPTLDEWKILLNLVIEQGLFPLFDFAYQGFGKGLEEDRAVFGPFIEANIPFAIATSYSKNFGLYAERTGALFIRCGSEEESQRVGSQMKILIRGMYSNPPRHGAQIVAKILKTPALSAMWEGELTLMRLRIEEMRKLFLEALKKKGCPFDFMAKQQGMFSYTCLKESQVERLKNEYAIYMPADGRINIAGLNTKNLEYVVDAIATVTR